jgi:flagellar hook-basal body complex protein FliE
MNAISPLSSGVLSEAVTSALQNPTAGGSPTSSQSGSLFAQALSKALEGASNAAERSNQAGLDLQLDKPNASVEELAIAMNTSSLEFTAVLQTRNKLIQAYTDLMSMPV